MRPCRYDLHLPVWYRVQGERSWHTGTTESVSRSGVMIRTHERNELNSLVRVVIELPNEDGSGTAGCLTGIGHVVRAQNADRSDAPSFAIAVKRYRVQRPITSRRHTDSAHHDVRARGGVIHAVTTIKQPRPTSGKITGPAGPA